MKTTDPEHLGDFSNHDEVAEVTVEVVGRGNE